MWHLFAPSFMALALPPETLLGMNGPALARGFFVASLDSDLLYFEHIGPRASGNSALNAGRQSAAKIGQLAEADNLLQSRRRAESLNGVR